MEGFVDSSVSAHRIPAPDWFDSFWDSQKHNLPTFLRNEAGKKLARAALDAAIQSGAQYAATPQGIRAVIAFARISAMLRGIQGVCDAPDPSPEQVVDGVERLLNRVKP